jgi:hypothetical protein
MLTQDRSFFDRLFLIMNGEFWLGQVMAFYIRVCQVVRIKQFSECNISL